MISDKWQCVHLSEYPIPKLQGIGKRANLALNLQKFNVAILLLQEHLKVKDAPVYLKGLSIQTNRIRKKGGDVAVAMDEKS